MDNTVLDNILLAWTTSGAELSHEPKRCNYLSKAKIDPNIRLLSEFGIPRILYTPECYYEIKSMRCGNVQSYLNEQFKLHVFVISI